MVEAEVQDKQAPAIIPPTNITIECDYPYDTSDLSNFGIIALSEQDRMAIIVDGDSVGVDGLAIDNCNVMVSESVSTDIDNCQTGTQTR